MPKHHDRRSDAARRQNRPAAERSPGEARRLRRLLARSFSYASALRLLVGGLLRAITTPALIEYRPQEIAT